jgi:hypothetical protein
MRHVRAYRRLAAGLTALAALPLVGVAAAPAAEATDYCKHITADSVRLFGSATGNDVIDVLDRGDVYFAQRSDGNRYHGYAYFEYPSGSIREYGWISNDPGWTAPC